MRLLGTAAFLALASRCGPAATDAPAPAPASSAADAVAESAAPDGAAACSAQHTDGAFARCRWRIATVRDCSPVRPPVPSPSTRGACVCDGCAGDADCDERAGGRCVAITGSACDAPSHACAYAGDPCATDACTAPRACKNDGNGHAVCAGRAPPRM